MPKGFFFRSDQRSVVALVADFELDPRVDDLFAEALRETRDDHTSNERRIGRLLARISRIEDEIAYLEASNCELEDRLSMQHEAIAAYQAGEDLSGEQRDLLTPRCAELESAEKRDATIAEYELHKDQLPDGWEVTNKRLDDDYIYVTIRRQRQTARQPDTSIKDKVRAALAQFFTPGFDRSFRVRWDQLGTLSPIVRGAP